jgi:hypothetical protein
MTPESTAAKLPLGKPFTKGDPRINRAGRGKAKETGLSALMHSLGKVSLGSYRQKRTRRAKSAPSLESVFERILDAAEACQTYERHR